MKRRSALIRWAPLSVILVSLLLLGWPVSAQPSVDEAGNDTSLDLPPGGDPPGSLPPPPPPAGCFDNDIQTTATASHSGGGSGQFDPANATDGLLGDPPTCNNPWTWISAGSEPGGEWFELEWAAPVTLCQIFVDTKQVPAECGSNPNRILSDATIQWWDGSQWVTAGQVSQQTDDWTFQFPTSVTTTRLRLFNVFTDPGPGPQTSNPMMYELKVYDGVQEPVPTTPTAWMLGLALLLATIGALVIALRRRAA